VAYGRVDVVGVVDGVLVVQFGVFLDGGQWCSQFVVRVGDEFLYVFFGCFVGGEGVFDLGEYCVEGCRQLVDFGGGGVFGYVLVEVVGRDGVGDVFDLLQWA